MALKPRHIGKDVVRAAVAEAVRARAPQSDLEEWYFKVAEGSGVGRDVIRRLARDAEGPVPEAVTLYRLITYWGEEFADECLQPLTGVRCTVEPGDAESACRVAASKLRDLAEDLENPSQRATVSDLAERRRA